MTTKTHNDSNVANTAGRDARLPVLAAWGKAEGNAQAALVACFVIVAQTGPTSAAEIAEARGLPEASCAAYASTFNRAAKVQDVLGVAPTLQLIADAAKGAKGRAKEAVYDALGAALSGAKAEGLKEATRAQGRALIKAALASCAEKQADRAKASKDAKAKRENSPRAPRQPNTGTMASAAAMVACSKSWTEGAATLRLIANTLNGAAVPEGMESQARTLLAALGTAVEAAQPFLRKVVKA